MANDITEKKATTPTSTNLHSTPLSTAMSSFDLDEQPHSRIAPFLLLLLSAQLLYDLPTNFCINLHINHELIVF